MPVNTRVAGKLINTMHDQAILIRWLTEIGQADRESVGGKAAALGEVAKLGLRTPRGFVVTVDSYKQCLQELKGEQGAATLTDSTPALSSSSLVAGAVRKALARLVANAPWPALAVRSSAVAEDSLTASFAGQFTSFLNVRGYDEVASRIEQCWASLLDPSVLEYSRRMQVPPESMAMAVLIQRMIPAEISGVLFTAHPVLGDPTHFVIEAGWGLGDTVVSGMQTPDTYSIRVDGTHIAIENEVLEKAGVMSRWRPESLSIERVPISQDRQRARTLTARRLRALTHLGQVITSHFGVPQDIEWAWYRGKFYILQSRPITIRSPR